MFEVNVNSTAIYVIGKVTVMNISFNISQLFELNKKYQNTYAFSITGVSSSYAPKNNTLIFMKKVPDIACAAFQTVKNCIIIVPKAHIDTFTNCQADNFIIPADNPRLEYAKILNFILDYQKNKAEELCLATNVGKNLSLGKESYIGHNVVIGDNVEIGTDCVIMPGVIINDNVKIGNHTIIRENSVIGGYGFGFERDENGIPIRLPHIGGVVIGNHVEVGALTTIASGTIEPTVIGDYTKIDDHVLVAHNCQIGEKCLIIGGSDLGGSVKIGNCTWLGPNSSIINGISIGDNCMVGIGAVVKKSVENGTTVSGNPAKSLESIKRERDFFLELKRLLKRFNI